MAESPFTAVELCGGPDGVFLIRSDGRLISWDGLSDEFVVQDDPLELIATLALGSRRYPELKACLPCRTPTASDCGQCGGNGIFERPGVPQFLLCSECDGLGWLPE
jgi:hypothetical protein